MYHFAAVAAVALERAQMTRALILRMIRMAEMRDPKETGSHVNRVAGFSVEIYEQWALRRKKKKKDIDKTRDVLRMAAMLHDVGKVATSDLILKKPARLNADEYEAMKLHTIQGARLFQNRQWPWLFPANIPKIDDLAGSKVEFDVVVHAHCLSKL